MLTTNIAKATDIDTNMNCLKITFINATPPINIGFNTVDVIGHPISARSAISIGIITCIIPIVESIVLLQISNTSLNPISVSETIVINTMYVVIWLIAFDEKELSKLFKSDDNSAKTNIIIDTFILLFNSSKQIIFMFSLSNKSNIFLSPFIKSFINIFKSISSIVDDSFIYFCISSKSIFPN